MYALDIMVKAQDSYIRAKKLREAMGGMPTVGQIGMLCREMDRVRRGVALVADVRRALGDPAADALALTFFSESLSKACRACDGTGRSLDEWCHVALSWYDGQR